VDRAVLGRAAEDRQRLVSVRDLLVEQPGLLEEANRVVAVGGTESARPALVLLAQARVLLPARFGEP
jgi:hypothetical protein